MDAGILPGGGATMAHLITKRQKVLDALGPDADEDTRRGVQIIFDGLSAPVKQVLLSTAVTVDARASRRSFVRSFVRVWTRPARDAAALTAGGSVAADTPAFLCSRSGFFFVVPAWRAMPRDATGSGAHRRRSKTKRWTKRTKKTRDAVVLVPRGRSIDCHCHLPQIAENAGRNGFVVLANVVDQPFGYGWNAATDTYEDLVAAGVVDPAKVRQRRRSGDAVGWRYGERRNGDTATWGYVCAHIWGPILVTALRRIAPRLCRRIRRPSSCHPAPPHHAAAPPPPDTQPSRRRRRRRRRCVWH